VPFLTQSCWTGRGIRSHRLLQTAPEHSFKKRNSSICPPPKAAGNPHSHHRPRQQMYHTSESEKPVSNQKTGVLVSTNEDRPTTSAIHDTTNCATFNRAKSLPNPSKPYVNRQPGCSSTGNQITDHRVPIATHPGDLGPSTQTGYLHWSSLENWESPFPAAKQDGKKLPSKQAGDAYFQTDSPTSTSLVPLGNALCSSSKAVAYTGAIII